MRPRQVTPADTGGWCLHQSCSLALPALFHFEEVPVMAKRPIVPAKPRRPLVLTEAQSFRLYDMLLQLAAQRPQQDGKGA